LGFGQVPDPDLRALKIRENGHRSIQPIRHLPDRFDGLTVCGVIRMRKIDAGHVHARLH
jgi:hypothetical protein